MCLLVFVLKTNIENFTNNNKLLFCQLSKLLKSNAILYEKHTF
ncbi:hypothetical protein VVMO6_02476 [Vibrio vulnificus MO6-24/O]|nr:hypothetical protein VVMO6_02476 [Vibrio vulnificus MO6-24/O]